MHADKKHLALLAAFGMAIGGLIGMSMTVHLGAMRTYAVFAPLSLLLVVPVCLYVFKPVGSVIDRLLDAMRFGPSESLYRATAKVILEAAFNAGEGPKSMDELLMHLDRDTVIPVAKEWGLHVSVQNIELVRLRCKAIPDHIVTEIFKDPKRKVDRKQP